MSALESPSGTAGLRRLPAVDDDSARWIVRGQRDRHFVTEHDADAVLAQLTPKVGEDLVAVF